MNNKNEMMDIETTEPVVKPTYDRFHLEAQINNCWTIIDELRQLPPSKETNEALIVIYTQKFLKLWDIFEELVEKDKIK